MADDLHRIKDWLKKQEVDDPIPTKSQDRVHDAMARNIRNTTPLSKGACHTCGSFTERLVPVQMKICPSCLERFTRKGGPQRIQKREVVRYYCDNCFGMTLTSILINPLICQKCCQRIGKHSRLNMADLKKRRVRDDKKYPFLKSF